MKRTTVLWGCVLPCLALAAAGAADFTSWRHAATVTFSGYTAADRLTNFPALVVLGTNVSGFSYSQFLSSTNDDLRFTD